MMNLTVMMYHYVRDAGDAAEKGTGIPGLPREKFAAQLDQLGREYEMVGWDDVRAALVEQKTLPRRACLLTFDDGVCDHYLNVFHELKRRNVAGLFFAMARGDSDGMTLPHTLHYLIARLGLERMREEIWERLNEMQRETYRAAEAKYSARWKSRTDVVKGIFQRDLAPEIQPILIALLQEYVGPEQEMARRLFLSEQQIREMRAGGMRFGGHSRTHPWFDFIDAAQRENEIRASQAWLKGVEQAPFAFAYPYGGLNDDAPQRLQHHDFCAAFTTREQTAHRDPFYIGRYDGEEWGV